MTDSPEFSLNVERSKTFLQPLRTYLPEEVLAHSCFADVASEILQSFEDLANPETAQKRATRMALGIEAQHFRERLFTLHENKLVIAGIRFKKLDPKFPFVHLGLNFVPNEDDFSDLKELVKKEFSVFQPLGMTLRQSNLLLAGLPHECWSHTLWGSLAAMQEEEIAVPLRTEFAASFAFYPSYLAEYQALLAKDAHRQTYLRYEEQEDLQAAAQKGLLFNVFDHQGWAGVIAGQEDEFYGFRCLYIFELFLVERLRGRGLAVSLEKKFLKSLAARFSHVCGHIHHTNLPSLRSALAVGRRIVESEHFFRF